MTLKRLIITLLFFPQLALCGIDSGNGSSGIALALEDANRILTDILLEDADLGFSEEESDYKTFYLTYKDELFSTLSSALFEPKSPKDFDAIAGCEHKDLCVVTTETGQVIIYFRSDAYYLVTAGLYHLFARLIHEAAHPLPEKKPEAYLNRTGLLVSKAVLTRHADNEDIEFAKHLYNSVTQEGVAYWHDWKDFQKILLSIGEKQKEMVSAYSTLGKIHYPLVKTKWKSTLEKNAKVYALNQVKRSHWFLNGESFIKVEVRKLTNIIHRIPKSSPLRQQLLDIRKGLIYELVEWHFPGIVVWTEGYDNGFWSSKPFREEWVTKDINIFIKDNFQSLTNKEE